jgi:hypothetical protein
VNGVGGDGEDSTLGEVFAQNLQTTFGSNTRKTDTRSRVDTETFIDASIEIGKTLDLLGGGNEFVFSTELFIEFLVELVLDITVGGEVVEDGAGGAEGECERHIQP